MNDNAYEMTYGSLRQDETFLIEAGYAAEMDAWAESNPLNGEAGRTVEITSRARLAQNLASVRATRLA